MALIDDLKEIKKLINESSKSPTKKSRLCKSLNHATLTDKLGLEDHITKICGFEPSEGTHGEDAYYPEDNMNKVEIKNICYYGKKNTIPGGITYKDLNPNRAKEFRKDYWLVIACWNKDNPDLLEIVFGFKKDDLICDQIDKLLNGAPKSIAVALTYYKHLFAQNKIKLLHYNKLSKNAYNKGFYDCLEDLVVKNC